MAMVWRYGSPDYFISMICNPDWPELKQAACVGLLQQKAYDRPDLVARVATLKFNDLIDQLWKEQIFSSVAAYAYTIEFQKRGLPHMHLLVIMDPRDKLRTTKTWMLSSPWRHLVQKNQRFGLWC